MVDKSERAEKQWTTTPASSAVHAAVRQRRLSQTLAGDEVVFPVLPSGAGDKAGASKTRSHSLSTSASATQLGSATKVIGPAWRGTRFALAVRVLTTPGRCECHAVCNVGCGWCTTRVCMCVCVCMCVWPSGSGGSVVACRAGQRQEGPQAARVTQGRQRASVVRLFQEPRHLARVLAGPGVGRQNPGRQSGPNVQEGAVFGRVRCLRRVPGRCWCRYATRCPYCTVDSGHCCAPSSPHPLHALLPSSLPSCLPNCIFRTHSVFFHAHPRVSTKCVTSHSCVATILW